MIKQEEINMARAKAIKADAKAMQDDIRAEEENKREMTNDAWDRLEWVAENYGSNAPRSLLDSIKKDLPDVNVDDFVSSATLDQRREMRLSGGGGTSSGISASDYLPPQMSGKIEPELTFEEFIDQQPEMQQTFVSPSAREDLISKNEKKWRDEYEAIYVDGVKSQNIQSTRARLIETVGENAVRAAELIIDGTYTGTNPIKNAAATTGATQSNTAIALQELRASGAVKDTETLSSGQQKQWNRIRDDLEKDVFYKTWNGARSAITRIEKAIAQKNAASDIAAINAFQNGIVDPGATVREGDVDLLQSAIAWFERINPSFILQIARGEAKMPESMRQQMFRLAKDIEQGYEKDFRKITVPRYRTLMTQNGIPTSIFDDYVGIEGGTVVSSDVSDFVSQKGY